MTTSNLSTLSNKEIPKTVLQHILRNEDFSRSVYPFLKQEYFENGHSILFGLFSDYFIRYNELPSRKSLEIEFSKSDHNTESNSSIFDLIEQLYYEEIDTKNHQQWLRTTTEEWCRDRAIYLAVIRSINIIDGGDKELDSGAIPDILSNALSVTFDRDVGHDYIDNASERFDFYNLVEEKTPFDLEIFNKITKGGVSNKTLNVILAGTGVGKSLAMCHFASSLLSEGKNVLYVTMEMAEERIAERIDANLLDVDIGDLSSLERSDFDQRIRNLQTSTNGRLIVKEYPTAQAHVGHFRALLKELWMKKEFRPDCIFIDYLNICASSRMRGVGGSVNTYTYVKSIAEEIRGLAVEQNVPIWTATQTNREGYSNSDVDLTNTSESFGLPATSDLMVAMISNEELEDMDQVMFKQLKNRYNDPTYYRRFVVGVDRAKMRLYDTDDSSQDDLLPEASEYRSRESSDFSSWTVK